MVDEIFHKPLKRTCSSSWIFAHGRPHVGFEWKIVKLEVVDIDWVSFVEFGVIESAEQVVDSFHRQTSVLSHHDASRVVRADGEEDLRWTTIGNDTLDQTAMFAAFAV